MISLVAQLALWIWFFGCIKSYETSKWILSKGVGIKSAEFVVLCLFTTGVVLYHAVYPVGKWFLLFVLSCWIIVQFFCHWYFTIFGVSEKKLKGYNECFSDTVRFIPASDTKLIPDLYHTILHILILINIPLVSLPPMYPQTAVFQRVQSGRGNSSRQPVHTKGRWFRQKCTCP